jgi:hypothetical protein
VEIGARETGARVQENRFEPELGFAGVPLNVHVRWFVPVAGVKEETKRAGSKRCRHRPKLLYSLRSEKRKRAHDAERPKLSDPARGRRGLQPERDGRVRCSAWLGGTALMINLSPLWKSTVHTLSGEQVADPPSVKEWSVALGTRERRQADGRSGECQQPKAGNDRKDNIGTD